jgi:hypothetical protein
MNMWRYKSASALLVSSVQVERAEIEPPDGQAAAVMLQAITCA